MNIDRKNFSAIMTDQYETSRGYAWAADLYLDREKIGVIENRGDGGPNLVRITHKPYFDAYVAAATAAFPKSFEADSEFALILTLSVEGEREYLEAVS